MYKEYTKNMTDSLLCKHAPSAEIVNVTVLNGSLFSKFFIRFPHFRDGKPASLQISDSFWTAIVNALEVALADRDIKEKELLMRVMIILGFLMNMTTIAFLIGIGEMEKLVLISVFPFLWIGPIILLCSYHYRVLHKRVENAIPSLAEGYIVKLKLEETFTGPKIYLTFERMSVA
jgi:hypothetical protein